MTNHSLVCRYTNVLSNFPSLTTSKRGKRIAISDFKLDLDEECCFDICIYLVRSANTINSYNLHRWFFFVKFKNFVHVVVVSLESGAESLFGVILSLREASVYFRVGSGLEVNVVDLASHGIRTTASNAFEKNGVIHVKEDDTIRVATGVLQGLGLHSGAREPIEDPSLFSDIGVIHLFVNKTNDQFVRNEFASLNS